MSHVAGVIAVEEVLSVDGRRIRQHALTWQVPVPVFLATSLEREVIGQLDTIVRHANYILGFGEVRERYPVLPCGVGLDLADVDEQLWDADGGLTEVVFGCGKIVEVTVYHDDADRGSRPAWPGCALLNHVAPVCTTCGRQRDDRCGAYCSNSFHLGVPL